MLGVKNTNKIHDLPIEIQETINTMLKDEISISKIVEFLKKNYPEYAVNRKTLTKYKNLDSVSLAIQEEEQSKVAQIVVNKKNLLDTLITDTYQRLQELKKINNKKFDPKFENFITSYIDIIRKLIETIDKLDEDFGDETKVQAIVKTYLSKLLQCVYATVKEICPDKMEEFQRVLKEKYEGIKDDN